MLYKSAYKLAQAYLRSLYKFIRHCASQGSKDGAMGLTDHVTLINWEFCDTSRNFCQCSFER